MNNILLYLRLSQTTKRCIRMRISTKQCNRYVKYMTCRRMATKIEDVCTHTGQKWDSHDYRLARFMNSPKVVNPSWAVNLIAEVPPKQVTQRIVWCDGGSGPEGHPRVYINLDKPGDHTCGYCGLRFVKIDH